MSDLTRYILSALVVLMTHFQEGITGFGSTALALPFLTLLLGLETAVQVLVIQALFLAIYIVVDSRRRIVWREFALIVIPVGIGLPFGMWMMRALPVTSLKWLLGPFMLGVGGHGLARGGVQAQQDGGGRPWTMWLCRALLPLGGVIHGAFGSGGPLIVAYATRQLPDKTLFRVTLSLLWLVSSVIMICQWAHERALSPHVLHISAICLIGTLTGAVLGNIAHYRIQETTFRRVVYGVLVLSGMVLIYSLLSTGIQHLI